MTHNKSFATWLQISSGPTIESCLSKFQVALMEAETQISLAEFMTSMLKESRVVLSTMPPGVISKYLHHHKSKKQRRREKRRRRRSTPPLTSPLRREQVQTPRRRRSKLERIQDKFRKLFGSITPPQQLKQNQPEEESSININMQRKTATRVPIVSRLRFADSFSDNDDDDVELVEPTESTNNNVEVKDKKEKILDNEDEDNDVMIVETTESTNNNVMEIKGEKEQKPHIYEKPCPKSRKRNNNVIILGNKRKKSTENQNNSQVQRNSISSPLKWDVKATGPTKLSLKLKHSTSENAVTNSKFTNVETKNILPLSIIKPLSHEHNYEDIPNKDYPNNTITNIDKADDLSVINIDKEIESMIKKREFLNKEENTFLTNTTKHNSELVHDIIKSEINLEMVVPMIDDAITRGETISEAITNTASSIKNGIEIETEKHDDVNNPTSENNKIEIKTEKYDDVDNPPSENLMKKGDVPVMTVMMKYLTSEKNETFDNYKKDLPKITLKPIESLRTLDSNERLNMSDNRESNSNTLLDATNDTSNQIVPITWQYKNSGMADATQTTTMNVQTSNQNDINVNPCGGLENDMHRSSVIVQLLDKDDVNANLSKKDTMQSSFTHARLLNETGAVTTCTQLSNESVNVNPSGSQQTPESNPLQHLAEYILCLMKEKEKLKQSLAEAEKYTAEFMVNDIKTTAHKQFKISESHIFEKCLPYLHTSVCNEIFFENLFMLVQDVASKTQVIESFDINLCTEVVMQMYINAFAHNNEKFTIQNTTNDTTTIDYQPTSSRELLNIHLKTAQIRKPYQNVPAENVGTAHNNGILNPSNQMVNNVQNPIEYSYAANQSTNNYIPLMQNRYGFTYPPSYQQAINRRNPDINNMRTTMRKEIASNILPADYYKSSPQQNDRTTNPMILQHPQAANIPIDQIYRLAGSAPNRTIQYSNNTLNNPYLPTNQPYTATSAAVQGTRYTTYHSHQNTTLPESQSHTNVPVANISKSNQMTNNSDYLRVHAGNQYQNRAVPYQQYATPQVTTNFQMQSGVPSSAMSYYQYQKTLNAADAPQAHQQYQSPEITNLVDNLVQHSRATASWNYTSRSNGSSVDRQQHSYDGSGMYQAEASIAAPLRVPAPTLSSDSSHGRTVPLQPEQVRSISRDSGFMSPSNAATVRASKNVFCKCTKGTCKQCKCAVANVDCTYHCRCGGHLKRKTSH